MKKRFFIAAFAAIAASATFTSCNCNGTSCTLNNSIDSISYVQGMLIGSNIAPQMEYDTRLNKDEFIKGLKTGLFADSTEYSYRMGEGVGYNIAMKMEGDVDAIGITMNKDIFLKAFIAAINEDSLLFTKTDANEIVNELLNKFLAEKRAKEEALAAATPEAKENLAKGEAWLAEKEKEEGVKKTESGLLYKEIKEGKGEKATKTSSIKMNYRGTLIDGTEFDNNENVGGTVAQFVPGFAEGLQLMNKGAIYEFYIPANLGYGVIAQGNIPSNSVLIFEVELLDIK